MLLLRYKRFWGVLLFPLALLLVSLASAFPHVTEQVYSTGIYRVLVETFGRLFSIVPVSIAQWGILALIASLLVYIVLQIRGAVKHRGHRRAYLAGMTATLLCVGGVLYFLFILLCGLNYHRESFAVSSGLDVRPSSSAELEALCGSLVDQANALREQVRENEYGVMESSFGSSYELAKFARGAYDMAAKDYPVLGGYTAKPKPVLFSRGMSYLDITGIYVPFTFEANVNVDVPDFWVPSTMLHELAHFKGFMREDEANFVSYLACMASGHPDLAYSGTVLALVHSSNALYTADQELYWQVMDRLSGGVRMDLAANSSYWQQFAGPVAQVSTAVNDVYLKTNRQESGVKSYGRMVDLLLAEHREQHEPDVAKREVD